MSTPGSVEPGVRAEDGARVASERPFDEAPAPSSVLPAVEGAWQRQGDLAYWVYWSIHAACGFALWTGVSSVDVALCLGLFWLRLFAITAGYHRYFAHRSFKTSRAFQFVLAWLGCMAIQKGPLWWAAGHRRHHKYSDTELDMHSPRMGFWWAHQAWIFSGAFEKTDTDRIRDFARVPELAWLNRWHIVPPLLSAVFCYAVGGFSGLVWGMAISTTVLWHSTYTINSLMHRWGSQRYDTGDDSRNNFWLALLTFGEGWHNNHHHYMSSVRQGFFWWEIDITYYILLALERLGLVWDLRLPPPEVVARRTLR